ncbi:PAS domain S-box protein [Hyalangium rubrum]|uniref:histidine kinase n=1 Tax=Hyalangium rubrum TaxID=3103134 RepID=A0ABU5GZV3_9BACT|nr:PAS domain S-box protein [Hyalangium sp. s54d21]MDY7226229.1 PAS domain S-box protein [Hyalangium sp. s54d21]
MAPQRSPTLQQQQSASVAHASASASPERSLLEEELESSRRMLHALTQVHADLVSQGDPQVLFEQLLALVLELTRSQYGFIGEVLRSPEGTPYLRAHAIIHITPSGELRTHLAASPEEARAVYDLQTLPGTVLTSGQPVRANGLALEPHPQGFPVDYPLLQSFLGLPFKAFGELVGMVGIANRDEGYPESLIEFLQPLLITCGNILHAWRNDTRRQEAEQALRLQQEKMKKLALVAARTSNAVIITDAQGLTEWVNEGFTRTTGYTLEEVRGRRPGDVLQGPGTEARDVETMRQALRRGQGVSVELLNYTKAGDPYWNLIEIQPVHDEQGKLVQFVAIESDVTPRRHLEQQVALSVERLQLALESAEDGMWDWDLRTGRLTVSPRWLSMLGYALGELDPSPGFLREKLCHPEDRAELDRRMLEHQEGRSPMYEFEHRLRHKSGRWVWVLGRAKVVRRDKQGQPLRIVGTNVDITSRKHAQERLKAFIQAIPDMIFQVRADGTCLGFKASTLDAPLMSPEQFIGKSLYTLPLPEPVLAQLRRGLIGVLTGSPLEVFEYAVDTPAGPQHYEARIVRSDTDEAMCIVRNITERKATEEQRRRHAEELEERVRQATRELESRQAQLIQSEKLASLGQMAASIAHEINNPVSYVSSNLGTLEDYISVLRRLLALYLQVEQALEAQPPEAVAGLLQQTRALREHERLEELLGDLDDLLGDAKEGTTRIREFIQGLKTFVREESGEPQLSDLNKGVMMTLRMLRHEFKHKCEVQCDLAPLPLLRCFPTQLNQVFMNLLLNAVQAIEQRGEIRVSSRQEGNEAVVRITDNGPGMSEETLSRIFTPFFTTKPAGQGTGLGLSICYAIINSHKGRIEVRSQLGQGTTFSVHLPLITE